MKTSNYQIEVMLGGKTIRATICKNAGWQSDCKWYRSFGINATVMMSPRGGCRSSTAWSFC